MVLQHQHHKWHLMLLISYNLFKEEVVSKDQIKLLDIICF